MIPLSKLRKIFIFSLPFILLLIYIIRWSNLPTFDLIRYNVNLNNLDYVTYTTKQGERHKLTPEENEEIVSRLISSMKYAPPRMGYMPDQCFYINKITFYLSKPRKTISIKIGNTDWACPWYFSDRTLKIVKEIVEKKIGLNKGVYLLPEPDKITILRNGTNPLIISKQDDGWEETFNLASLYILTLARGGKTNYSDLKRVWINRAEYTLKITYDMPVKLSLSYIFRFWNSYDSLGLSLDDFGAPIVETKEIFISLQKEKKRISEAYRRIVAFKCENNNKTYLFGISGGHPSRHPRKNFKEFKKLLKILNNYYSNNPAADKN